MQYTDQQQAIIQHSGGHARIIAVAGSGKTQTLTAYVQQRLAAGVPRKRLLVLMYNKAAQIDFEQRLRGMMPGDALPDVRTFHSLGYRICQTLIRQGDMLPFKRELLSDGEIETALWMILRECAPESLADDVLSRKKKWVEPALAYLERVKSQLDPPEVVFEQTGLPDSCRFFIEAFHRFEDWRSDQRRFSYSDLICEPVMRFAREPHLAKQFGGHMAEIIVDEYQDINPVQQRLLEVLQGDRAQLMVVGDPDQTIYEFRGSKPQLLSQTFGERFKPVHDYPLSHTFRFGHALSLLANQVIAGNYAEDHDQTRCVSDPVTTRTELIRLVSDDSAQAAFDCIQRWQKTHALEDIAVINRLWANSARLELLLLEHSVRYQTDQPFSVLERHELRPLRVLLQLADGQGAQWGAGIRRQAWQSLLTQPYLKIRKAIVDQLIRTLVPVTQHWGPALRNAVPDTLSRYQSEALFERARWIEKAERSRGDAYTVLHGWVQGTDYYTAMKENAFSASAVDDQKATVQVFLSFVRSHRWSLAAGASQLNELIERSRQQTAGGVLITSIHKSKGREWPCVIIPELNGQFYPYQPESEMSMPTSVSSERRLLYVAMTRARHKLAMIVPTVGSSVPPSSFLSEAFIEGARLVDAATAQPEDDLSLPSGMHRGSVEAYCQYLNLGEIRWMSPSEPDSGQRVRHPNLGLGQIVEQTEQRLRIHFIRDDRIREFDRTVVTPLLDFL